jgi:aryl-alcohol dehydrogenase-like predicted oxidoreductase
VKGSTNRILGQLRQGTPSLDRGDREDLRSLVPAGATLAQMALRWILMSDAVTAAIPGAKTPEQARANAAAADLAPLPPAAMERIARLYEEHVKPLVHQRW